MKDNLQESEPMPNPIRRETKKQKQAHWNKMAAEVDKTVDALGMPVDPGIKDTVITLKLLGFDTDGSCEGHAEKDRPRACAGPWVDLTSQEIKALEPERERIFEESRKKGEPYLNKKAEKRVDEIDAEKLKVQAKAMDVIAKFYQGRKVPYDTMIIVHPTINGRIQCMGTEVAELLPLDQKATKLKQYQQEMAAFTQFLKDKYFNS